MKKLHGKVALVTGGASGIGAALSQELASRGAAVVVTDRQGDVAEEVAKRCRASGGEATSAELDVRDVERWREVVKTTLSRSRRIDYLFNNAGIAVGREMSDCDREDYDDVIDVNLKGVCYGVETVYRAMIAQGSGHIVNTASVAGLIGVGGAGSYSATKHGVVGLTKALRIEGKKHGIRASVLCPGAIRTPILTGGRFGRFRIPGATDAAILEQWEIARPMAPDAFAKRALDRVLANDPIIVVPSFWKALWYLDRISPSLALAVATRVHERLRDELTAGASAAHGATATNGDASRAQA